MYFFILILGIKKMDEELLNIFKYASSPAMFIKDIVGLEVKPFHKEWLDLLQSNDRIVLLAPRSTGKSLITSGYLLWKICQYPEIRVLMVTMNSSKAEEMMTFIKSNLESNEKLTDIYGEQQSRNWSSSEIRIKNRGQGIIHKEPTLTVLGVGSGQVSSHYDMIILDDIMDNNNCLTRARRQKIEEWYNLALVPMLEPGGQIIAVGTRWHSDDFYNYLMEKSIFTTKLYKAIIDYDTKEVIWPERYSFDDLIELRDENIGKVAFEMQYQNKIIQTEDSPINSEWIDSSKDLWKNEDKPEHMKIYMGVDLASKSSEGDYFAVCVVGMDENNRYWVLETVKDKVSMNTQLDIIKSLGVKHTPTKIGIESNAAQRIIVDQWAEDKTLPIMEIKSSWINDKWARVQRLAVLLETGRIIMNPNLEELCDELISFPRGKHDDLTDSLAFAIQASGDIQKPINWDKVLSVISSRKIVNSGLIKI